MHFEFSLKCDNELYELYAFQWKEKGEKNGPHISDLWRRTLLLLLTTQAIVDAGFCGAAPHTVILLVSVLTQTAVLTSY